MTKEHKEEHFVLFAFFVAITSCSSWRSDHAFDEFFEATRIGEPALVFHRQIRKLTHQRVREQTPPGLDHRDAVMVEDLHLTRPAAR